MKTTTQVTKIVDGDTIHVTPNSDGQYSVRLLGIDTAETYYRGQNQGKYAEAAKTFLKEKLQVGDTIQLESDGEAQDRYKRILAYVFKDDININVALVRAGLAAPYAIYPNQKYFLEIREASTLAQKENKGMFDVDDPAKELPFEFRMRIDKRKPHKFVGDYLCKQYVRPTDYKEVPIENRLFFFKESDAVKAGYTARKNGADISHIVNKAYSGLSFKALLKEPVSALKGLSKNDARLLNEAFGIETIEELAENQHYKAARAIKDLAGK